MESEEKYLRFSTFRPDTKYLRKIYIYSIITSLFMMIALLPLGFIIYGVLKEIFYPNPSLPQPIGVLEIILIILLVSGPLIISLGWSKLHYNALNYEIARSEIVIKSGVIFKKDVIIPMRTITNLDVIMGPVDRIMGLATVNIQTAGSNSLLAEGRFVGLLKENAEDLRDLIKNRLQLIQGGDGTGMDTSGSDPVERVLVELRAIKNVLIEIRDTHEG